MDKKPLKEKKIKEEKDRYFEAVGRRKTAIARVRIYTKIKSITVNGRDYKKYFPILRMQKAIVSPIEKMKIDDKLGISVKVKGGGLLAQAEAIRHGVSRALVKFNINFKKRLRRVGYLTRDSRAVERKKYGLRGARRGRQWRKR